MKGQIAAAIALWIVGSGSATANSVWLDCNANDDVVEFNYSSEAVDEAESFSQGETKLRLKANKDFPEKILVFNTTKKQRDLILGQNMYTQNEVRIWMYSKNKDVNLLLVSEKSEDNEYTGKYELTYKINKYEYKYQGECSCFLSY